MKATMKIKIAFLLIFINSWINIQSQVQKALAMPEYNILYQNYKNVIFPASKDGFVNTPIAENALVEEFEIEGRTKGFIIVPKKLGELVVIFPVANQTGKIIGTDSIEYFVRRVPTPIVSTSKISKSTGSIIHVGQSEDSPLNISYNVISIEVLGVDNGVCFGPNIPGTVVSKLKVGKRIGINVTLKNGFTGGIEIIPGTLEVTN